MKKILFLIIIIIFSIQTVNAQENNLDLLEESLNSLNLEQYDTIINKNILDYEGDFSFSQTVKQFVTGQADNFSLKNIFNFIIRQIFQEVFENSKFIKNIIIVAILCAILKILTESFKNQGVGEIGFYTGYIIIITLVISSFNISLKILETTVTNISGVLKAIAPLLAGTLIMSGQTASATVFSTFLISFIGITDFLIHNFFIPIISCATILSTVNYIVPKQILHNLVDFLKWIVTFSIKSTATIFISIISFQRIASPMVNMSVHKTARTLIGFIPVVGSAIGNAMDGVIHFITILKGGIGLAIFIVILICTVIPILKLVSIIMIYKITAVIIEPISDKRLTSCISSISEFTKLVLSTLILFLFLFLFFVLIMLSISS